MIIILVFMMLFDHHVGVFIVAVFSGLPCCCEWISSCTVSCNDLACSFIFVIFLMWFRFLLNFGPDFSCTFWSHFPIPCVFISERIGGASNVGRGGVSTPPLGLIGQELLVRRGLEGRWAGLNHRSPKGWWDWQGIVIWRY